MTENKDQSLKYTTRKLYKYSDNLCGEISSANLQLISKIKKLVVSIRGGKAARREVQKLSKDVINMVKPGNLDSLWEEVNAQCCKEASLSDMSDCWVDCKDVCNDCMVVRD